MSLKNPNNIAAQKEYNGTCISVDMLELPSKKSPKTKGPNALDKTTNVLNICWKASNDGFGFEGIVVKASLKEGFNDNNNC